LLRFLQNNKSFIYLFLINNSKFKLWGFLQSFLIAYAIVDVADVVQHHAVDKKH